MTAPIETRAKIIATLLLCLSYLCSGLCYGLPGPSLLDLAVFTNSTVHGLFWFQPAGSVGYLIGSFLCGGLLDRCRHKYPFMAVFIFVMAVSQILIPWQTSAILLVVANLVASIGIGAIEVAGNSQIFAIWGAASEPYMQVMQACFSSGCLLAPLLVEPFLLPHVTENSGNYKNISTLISQRNSSTLFSHPLLANSTNHSASLDSFLHSADIRISYAISGLFSVLVTVLFCCRFGGDDNASKESKNDVVKTTNVSSKLVKHLMVGGAFLMMLVVIGSEFAFGRYLTTFVVNSRLRQTKAAGAFMTTLFWLTITVARFVFMIIAKFMTSTHTLALGLAILFFGHVVLVASVIGFESVAGLWFAVALLGFGWSPMFGSIFSFLNQFVPITVRISTVLSVAFSIGESVIPLLDGFYIEDFADFFVYLSVGCSTFSILLFISLFLFTRVLCKK